MAVIFLRQAFFCCQNASCKITPKRKIISVFGFDTKSYGGCTKKRGYEFCGKNMIENATSLRNYEKISHYDFAELLRNMSICSSWKHRKDHQQLFPVIGN